MGIYEDDVLQEEDISFEELVLMYIYAEDYEQDMEDDEDFEDEDILSEEEEEDYISLAEYYYSR